IQLNCEGEGNGGYVRMVAGPRNQPPLRALPRKRWFIEVAGLPLRKSGRALAFSAYATTTSGRSFCQREPHLKASIAGFRTNLNISPVLLHNSLDSVQAEARPFPNSFGCEKRLKDVRFYLG